MFIQPNITAHIVDPLYRPENQAPLTVTHYIGPCRQPFLTSELATVYTVVPMEPMGTYSDPHRKVLNFLQIGNPVIPCLYDYPQTCRAVEFVGHVGDVQTAFRFLRHLPKVERVKFVVGEAQKTYWAGGGGFPRCKKVTTLEIGMDSEHFHSFQHQDCNGQSVLECSSGLCFSERQDSLVTLMENILKRAGKSFPNLETLNVQLPDNPRLVDAVNSVILACPRLI